MKKQHLFTLVLFCLSTFLYSQDKEAEEFKPSGSVIARAFLDYSTDFDNESGFDITRAFLGYKYQILPQLSGQVIIDGAAGNKDDRLEVYVRNAFLNWKDERLNVNVGLIGLLQFSKQEKYWGYRYVLKSFQDLNKMAPSVDLGFTAEYKIADFVSADISLTNGTGYKEVKKSGSKRYAAGLSFHPVKNTIFRVYSDIYNESEDLRDKLPEGVAENGFKNQYTLSLLGGYQNDLISAGVEYNKVFNKGFIENKDYFGYSIYSGIKIHPKWKVYARYDLTDSNTPSTFSSQWNDLDGQLIIAGIEFKPFKQIKISPNFRNLNPDRDKSKQYLYINLEFNL